MKSLDEHNEERSKQIADIYAALIKGRGAGVGCPKCGAEMSYTNEILNMGNPPTRSVACPDCKHIGYKVA